MSYIEVLENILDSKDVTVGGGSASALSGAMAAGLIGMVARLSLNKEYGLEDSKYLELADELDVINSELIKGVEEDAKAYSTIIEAYKHPKSTDEEKALRKQKIENAGVTAATAPLNNAKLCNRVLQIGQILDGKSNKNAASDISIGINLAKIGVDGCIQNIEANLPLIKNEEILAKFKNEIDNLK
ncbi:MAG: formiminotransferase-cyclodeaminase [Bacillota bacterium]|jgi:formiminotetrahydrofolate cyclodeaminase|nr:formiminotransferase-cyclodeaminase [Bacillota bacterium]